MTNWTPREIEVNLDFLDKAREWKAEIWEDGINAACYPSDFVRMAQKVLAGQKIKLNLAPGGGAVIRFSPVRNTE
jgi:Glycoside hydrolase 97.